MPPTDKGHNSIHVDPGFALHQATSRRISEFLYSFENDHMKWLEEILEVAKTSFQRTKQPELLPKTPSAKNRRKRLRGRKDTEENIPLSKKRRSQSLSLRRSSVRRSVLVPLVEEEVDEDDDFKTSRKQSKGKRKKGVRIQETGTEEASVEDGQNQSPEKEGKIQEVGELQDKASEAPTASTSPAETRKTRRGASRAAALRMKRQLDGEQQANTPPRMTRMTRTASRTALQRSRLGSARNVTEAKQNQSVEAESTSAPVKTPDVTEDTASVKAKWDPKVELRHVIHPSKVKQLIHVHEDFIVASSSEDERTPPKRLRLAGGKKGCMEPVVEKPEDNAGHDGKLFPPVSSDESKNTVASAVESNEDEHSSTELAKMSSTSDSVSDLDGGSGKEENVADSITTEEPQEAEKGTSQAVVSSSSSQDEGSSVSQEEVHPVESCEEDTSGKSQEENKPTSESNTDGVTQEGSEQKEESYEDSLEDAVPLDMEEDSLVVEPIRRQLRSRTMSVANSKSEDDESSGQQKRPNRAIRTKQRKGKKLSKKRSSVASIRSRSYRKSRSIICNKEEMKATDNEADDESSPRRKIRRSDPEKVEVVVCDQNDTMELFEDSLEPSAQSKSQQLQVSEEETVSDAAVVQPHDSPALSGSSLQAESAAAEVRTEDSNEDEESAAKIRKLDPADEETAKFSTPVKQLFSHGSSDDHTSGGSAVESSPSPRSTGSRHLRYKNHVSSLLNSLSKKRPDSGNYPVNANGVITSFIKRNTPLKAKSVKERQKEIKQQIEKKQKKEEEIRRRREVERTQRLEEQRRKREERAKRAAEAREKRQQIRMEKAQQMEEKYEQKQALTEKVKEERKKEEMNKKKIFNKKKAEAEARRKQEEEMRVQKLKEQEEEQRRHHEMLQRKKEYEDAERAKKLEEARKRQEERLAELEREREREIQMKKEQELEKEKERLRLKEQREKQREEERKRKEEEKRRLQLEKERKAREEDERRAQEEMERKEAERRLREEVEKKTREEKEERMRLQREMEQQERDREERERERLKANILAHNTSQKKLNTTITMESESYELTPQRVYKPATEENYDIGDLGSGDSTDDEDAPRKKIPKWAQGAALKATLMNQELRPPNLDLLFDVVEPPDLSLMFKKKRSRFFKRTSSAVWDSPMLKAGH